MKEFTYATEVIIEIIEEAIRNNDMEKFYIERRHAATDAYIAHIDAVDARVKTASTDESMTECLHRRNKEELELHYEDKASLLYDIGRTLEKLISQVHSLEDLNIEIERIENEEAEHECGE